MPVSLSQEQRRLRAQIAVHTRYAQPAVPDTELVEKAAELSDLISEIDPHLTLSMAERVRRAEAAQRLVELRAAFAATKSEKVPA